MGILSSPLVSVVVYNRNYGRFLRDCLQSVFDQTYENWEIIFSDNASTDESWDIALEFQRRFPSKITLVRNHRNVGAASNKALAQSMCRGEYVIFLGSDDVLDESMLEVGVRFLVKNPDSAFCMVHRFILDNFNRREDELPFYDANYKLYPPSQVGVYLMSSINPTMSQIIYRKTLVPSDPSFALSSTFFSPRLVDFWLALNYPILYLCIPLVGHRCHENSHTKKLSKNMLQIVGPYVLNHQFMEIAESYEFTRLDQKFPKGLAKLSDLSIRYACEAACNDQKILSQQYWHLSQSLDPTITDRSDELHLLRQYFAGSELDPKIQNSALRNTERNESFKPDPPFEKLEPK